MKHPIKVACLLGTLGIASVSASAQTVGIGTTKGTAFAQIASAVATIVTKGSDLKMRPQPMGGTQQYFPMVNAGELSFGVSNVPQYVMGVRGNQLFDRKHENLRLVATLMTFHAGLIAPNSLGIKKLSDIKGRTFPIGFTAAPVIGVLQDALLANTGLTRDDIKPVPVVGLPQHWELMKQGKLDIGEAAIGAASMQDLNASISGGVSFISLDNSAAAVKRSQDVMPATWISTLKPNPRLLGFDKPLNVLSYDVALWANKDVADAVVHKTVKALFEDEKGLKETSPLWRSFTPRGMGKDFGAEAPYHPAAVKFYKDAGVWNTKM